MDQGFIASEGLAVPKIAARAKVPAHPAAPASSTATHVSETIAKGVSVQSNVAKGERETEQSLRGAQNKLMLPAMIDFLGGIVLWVGSKMPFSLPRFGTVAHAVIKAPIEALRKTEIKDVLQLPSNYLGEIAHKANAANATKWAESATATSSKLATKGEAWSGAVSKAFSSIKESGFMKAMPAVVKTVASKVGRTNLFTGLILSGVAAGVGATLIGARAESKESKAAFKGLMADLGNGNSGFAKAVKSAKHSKENWDLAKTGIELASGALDGVLWTKPGMGGMAMMGVIALPQLCSTLVPDNPLLGAYTALKKADAGELQLQPAQRLDLMKQLIAITPNVAAHGGIYNKLVTPIAAELLERKMTTTQIVQLLGNEAEFTKFAAEVNAKREAAKKAEQSAVGTKAELKPVAAEATVHGKAEAANLPSLKVGGIQHQGRIEHAERLRA